MKVDSEQTSRITQVAERPVLPRTRPLWQDEAVRPVAELLARRWVLQIVEELWERPLRRVQLQKRLEPISDKILTGTLRELIAAGYVSRHFYEGTPPRVVYRLSRRGHSLGQLLALVTDWSVTSASLGLPGLGDAENRTAS
jgi:DNA-binding HxlR family transcriptional regulator